VKSTRGVQGRVFNIQRFSIEDGPGIRTTVFLKGCPLQCLWCSNPESQNPFPEIAHSDSLCNGCGKCVEVCPEQAIILGSGESKEKIKIDRGKCNNCGKCIEACIFGALKFYGQTMSVDEVFDEVKKDMGFYSNSGGGVTASGGEPLSQADFVAELFRRCREEGIHTAIETCGYYNVSAAKKVFAETDLVMFDLKLMNRLQHKRVTGKYNDLIHRNIRSLVDRGVPTIIRIPVIPGINDSEENLAEIARFVQKLDKKLPVELLRYHRFGVSKYKMLDRDYQLTNLEPPPQEQLQKSVEIFKKYGLDCALQ
jgi:pyruvate formate lyase activating enzyme